MVGYWNVMLLVNSVMVKNLISLLRKLVSCVDFVRGVVGFFLFVLGGLDSIEVIVVMED